ncbi:MAG: glycosyltransferase family 4 protein [Planctomycetota bacterium]
MRILIACPTLGISSEVWILRQIEGFAKIGHNLSVVCWKQAGYEPQQFTDKPVEVLPFGLPLQGGLGRWLQRAKHATGRNFVRGSANEEKALKQILSRLRPDVMLCHFGHVAMRVLPVAKKLNIPVIAHFHGADLSSKLSDRWYGWTLASQAKRFDQVVVVGSHQARLLQGMGVPDNRLSLIPCGVPTEQFHPEPRPAREEVCFIQVSRIVPWKGIEQALRAFAQVHVERGNTRFKVIGEGDQLDAMKRLATELGIGKAVHFMGALPPDRVVEAFQQSDVFLQHSLTHDSGWCEGFGVSIAEAASMGLPVVVTRSGGIPDQVLDGQTGFLVEERDIQRMAASMLDLVDQPGKRQQMGQAGQQRMRDHFDSARQIAKLEQVLQKAGS